MLGGGTIGMLTALVLADRGFDQVVLVSRNPARAELASGPRADRGVASTTFGAQAAACVFECAGTPAAARLAIELVRPLGRVMLVGVSLEPLDLAAPALRVQGGRAARRARLLARELRRRDRDARRRAGSPSTR